MKLHSPLRLLAALSLAGASFFAQAATEVTVAYQTTVDPAKVAQADGAYERAIDANGLRPVIDKHFGLEQIADAFRYQETNQHFGKIVLDI